MEEELRELACLGNLDGVKKLLQSGASLNSQNTMNGWTALHWASKRGHTAVVRLLLQSGANPGVRTHDKELPIDVAMATDVVQLLMDNSSPSPSGDKNPTGVAELPITPNYLATPPFPYYDQHSRGGLSVARTHEGQTRDDSGLSSPTTPLSTDMKCLRLSGEQTVETRKITAASARESSQQRVGGLQIDTTPAPSSLPLVVRVRVSGSGEEDFVEAEVPSLTYHSLLTACCQELEVGVSDIVKIRKLPNVWVRKDRDVQRMKEGQELEVVLKITKERDQNFT